MHHRLIGAALLAGMLAAAPAMAQGWKPGDAVRASPSQGATGWLENCAVVAGPLPGGMYSVRCDGRTQMVPASWIQPAGRVTQAAPGPAPRTALPAPPARANAPVVAARGMPPGKYECWAFNTPRLLLNFAVTGPGRYIASDGSAGSFFHDGASGAVRFTGYLAEVVPEHWQVIYHEPNGKPTVSFRNRGSEASFCEKAG